jgi:hypothetical protein
MAAELSTEFAKIVQAVPGVGASLNSTGSKPTRGRGKGVGKPPSGNPPPSHLTSQQAEIVGFSGELYAYQWLKRYLTKQNIDKAWVSKLSEILLPREGDDSLGYDFEFYFNRRKHFMEVKAHLGDPGTFELGESQVLMAQKCDIRGHDPGTFKILYVYHLSEKSKRGHLLLPNPFTDEGRQRYSIIGRGLRYKFGR